MEGPRHDLHRPRHRRASPFLGRRHGQASLAGAGAGSPGGARHVKYAEPTPLANLHLTLLERAGVRLDAFADSKGRVDELLFGVNIAMQSASSGQCSALDVNASSAIEIPELVAAMGNALRGCDSPVGELR